jgi:hypothetical protein
MPPGWGEPSARFRSPIAAIAVPSRSTRTLELPATDADIDIDTDTDVGTGSGAFLPSAGREGDMSMKGSGPATAFREIDRFDGGVGWISYPDERMQRASHALTVDGDVWLVDPVDAEGLDDLLADLGEVVGVVVLLDRHERDAASLARRHDVAVHLPTWMKDTARGFSVPVEPIRTELADTGYRVRRLLDTPFWKEAALWNDDGTLVVPEAVGTADYYTTDEERLGVHPMVRLFPPRRLRGFAPERILLGHGAGITSDTRSTLDDTLRGSRRRAPQLYAETARALAPW